jgi:putative endonuclease
MNSRLLWFVYILLCDNKYFYFGITNNILRRLSEHKHKHAISTKEFSRIKLVYCEKYENMIQAALREKQLKGWSHAKKQMLVDNKLGINACPEVVEESEGGEARHRMK